MQLDHDISRLVYLILASLHKCRPRDSRAHLQHAQRDRNDNGVGAQLGATLAHHAHAGRVVVHALHSLPIADVQALRKVLRDCLVAAGQRDVGSRELCEMRTHKPFVTLQQ